MLWKRGCVLAFRYVALALGVVALALKVVASALALRVVALALGVVALLTSLDFNDVRILTGSSKISVFTLTF